ncbi:MAG: 3-methyl-2-oxobutanoate hydroxymethyltransferase [Chitinophagaceae bacterium]|nr:3-methyl-2-oxobutanoate hydroxymethyltransferase [Oligoflexus sp.]
MTVKTLLKRKQDGQKITMLTCYDAAFGGIVDKTALDMVLVGDSLGNVVLGMKDTISVTMDIMVHHTAAVARTVKRAMLVADMPFMSYNISVEQALTNAARLIQEGGAQAVKVEGGSAIVPQIRAMVTAGIPVVGHLGLTPQSIHTLGGYKVQGRGDEAAKMLREAKELADAGVCAIVLELVPQGLAKEITAAVKVPTIGIGAGPDTDGQVLVLHDMLGFPSEFSPKFLKRYATLGETIAAAVAQYDLEVKQGSFPAPEHTFQ